MGTDGNLRVWRLWAVSFKRPRGHVTIGKAGYWVKASVGTPRCWSGHLRSPILPGDELESLFKIGNNAAALALGKRRHMAKSAEFTHFWGRIRNVRDYKAFLLTRLSPNTIGSHRRDAFFKVIQYFSVFFCRQRWVLWFNGPCWIPPKLNRFLPGKINSIVVNNNFIMFIWMSKFRYLWFHFLTKDDMRHTSFLPYH